VTFQVSQIHSPESSLWQDPHVQNTSETSFQRYLEEEQRRLAFFFSPFGQFNFGSWFGYPDPTAQADPSTNTIELFSDIDLHPPQNQTQNYPSDTENRSPELNQTLPLTANHNLARPAQILLQDLLAKTGWLAPNLEAVPLFHQAQLQGRLLNKLDLQFLVDQILSQVKLVKDKGKVELTLGLRPENLGEILLTLTSRSGMISIRIQAPEEARKLLEAQLTELEAALKKAKVNLEDIQITALKEVKEHA
jgi:flagellar hook-length control protein FliK